MPVKDREKEKKVRSGVVRVWADQRRVHASIDGCSSPAPKLHASLSFIRQHEHLRAVIQTFGTANTAFLIPPTLGTTPATLILTHNSHNNWKATLNFGSYITHATVRLETKSVMRCECVRNISYIVRKYISRWSYSNKTISKFYSGLHKHE